MTTVRHVVFLTNLIACVSPHAFADERKAYVLNATEGDMLEFVENNKQYRVHIAGITAPAKDSEHAKLSKQALPALTFGRWVQASCVMAPHKAGERPKPRPLYCRVEFEGADLALAQLQAGKARYGASRAFGLSSAQLTE
jgi:endonuclease YncB( thermonuclease family)